MRIGIEIFKEATNLNRTKNPLVDWMYMNLGKGAGDKFNRAFDKDYSGIKKHCTYNLLTPEQWQRKLEVSQYREPYVKRAYLRSNYRKLWDDNRRHLYLVPEDSLLMNALNCYYSHFNDRSFLQNVRHIVKGGFIQKGLYFPAPPSFKGMIDALIGNVYSPKGFNYDLSSFLHFLNSEED